MNGLQTPCADDDTAYGNAQTPNSAMNLVQTPCAAAAAASADDSTDRNAQTPNSSMNGAQMPCAAAAVDDDSTDGNAQKQKASMNGAHTPYAAAADDCTDENTPKQKAAINGAQTPCAAAAADDCTDANTPKQKAAVNDAQTPYAAADSTDFGNVQKQKVEIFNPVPKLEAERDAQAWFPTKELRSDLQVEVGDTQFYLHKFPLLSRSGLLNKLVFESRDTEKDHMKLLDLPGGPYCFQIAAKFCYGLAVEITPANVAALRCASAYLDMTEELQEGNLAARTEAFLTSVVLPSWKYSIAVLRLCSKLLPWAEDLQIVQRCIESIAWKACTDIRSSGTQRGRSRGSMAEAAAEAESKAGFVAPPQDWWLEDVCRLSADYFVRTVNAMKAKDMRPDLVGAAVACYAFKRLPNLLRASNQQPEFEAAAKIHGVGASAKIRFFYSTTTTTEEEEEETEDDDISQGFDLPLNDNFMAQESDDDDFLDTPTRQIELLMRLMEILPLQNSAVSMGFLLQLLRAANLLAFGSWRCKEIEKLVSTQLEEVSLQDLLRSARSSSQMQEMHSAMEVDMVCRIVQQFVVDETKAADPKPSRVKAVAKLMDGYLAEMAKDSKLPLQNFQDLVDALPQEARISHDGLYKAIDNFLMAHEDMGEGERQKLCRRIDLHRLTTEASLHASQNERLPLCTAVQVLFAEHVKLRRAIGRAAEERRQGSNSDVESEEVQSSTAMVDVRMLEAEVQKMRMELMGLKRECEGLQEKLLQEGGGRSSRKSRNGKKTTATMMNMWWDAALMRKKIDHTKKLSRTSFIWC